MSPYQQKDAILSVSSHVMRGSVGNRAMTFALMSLGFPVWSVPTIVLPWHPGQGAATRLTFDERAFEAALEDLEASPARAEISCVVSGYFANASQVKALAKLIVTLRRERPNLLYICDPIIGDRGGLYVSEKIAEEIRASLLPLASLATPNRFELGWLAGKPVDSNLEIAKAVEALNLPEAIVTSAHAMMAGAIANLHIGPGGLLLAEHRELASVPNGLGDLFSALIAARLVNGQSREEALELATAGVYQAAARAAEAGANELMLEGEQNALHAPHMHVQLRKLHGLKTQSKQD